MGLCTDEELDVHLGKRSLQLGRELQIAEVFSYVGPQTLCVCVCVCAHGSGLDVEPRSSRMLHCDCTTEPHPTPGHCECVTLLRCRGAAHARWVCASLLYHKAQEDSCFSMPKEHRE
jgi:hypothetical protein